MKIYAVTCEWNPEGAWTVTVPEVPGAVTQSRRLDQVAADVGEALELMTGSADFTIEITEIIGSAVASEAVAVRALRAEAERAAAVAEACTREAAAKLRSAGFTYRDAGALLGVSHQRVQQLTS